jgi:hypothetical protein
MTFSEWMGERSRIGSFSDLVDAVGLCVSFVLIVFIYLVACAL